MTNHGVIIVVHFPSNEFEFERLEFDDADCAHECVLKFKLFLSFVNTAFNYLCNLIKLTPPSRAYYFRVLRLNANLLLGFVSKMKLE